MNHGRDRYHQVTPTSPLKMPSKRLIFSYIFDWIIIIIIAGIGGGLSFVTPHQRAFSLVDLNISFPYVDETISTLTLILVALVAPAVIIAVIALVAIPGRRFSQSVDKSKLIRIKLWELEKGLAGLALSVAIAFFITQGTKNLFGKPRPDFLARCQPDMANVAAHIVGGYGQQFNEQWVLVDVGICTQKNKATLDDGFRSFPSGHSSWSWSGLLYLSLFLCSKFAITIPYLPVLAPGSRDIAHSRDSDEMLSSKQQNYEPIVDGSSNVSSDPHARSASPEAPPVARTFAYQNAAATPPNYLLIPAFIPIAVAIYICSTRFVEYYHFGFDIISGSVIGILSAWFAFRWYHLPISRGHGWAWGPRSSERAFGIGVGTEGYHKRRSWQEVMHVGSQRRDVEAGPL